MDVFVLDNGFRRTIVVEHIHSFIWTDRYAAYGDFEMVVAPTELNMEYLVHTRYLGQSESDRIMMIDEVTHERNENGERVMKVKGRSLEAILQHRVINSDRTLSARGVRVRTGTVSKIAIDLINFELRYFDESRRYELLTNLVSAEEYQSGKTVEFTTTPGPLYDTLQDICRLDDLGFKITWRFGEDLRFAVYKGFRRGGVTFSESLDNLKNSTYVSSTRDYANIAHVWDRDHRTMRVIADRGNTITRSGFERRVIYVHASGVDSSEEGMTWDKVTPLLREVAVKELRKHDRLDAFDGEAVGDQFVYGEHYEMGDIVNIFDDQVSNRQARVTEYIWSLDDNGLSQYPTFTTLPE